MTFDPYLLLLLIACLFTLVFGGLSYLRREGLSVQFAVEAAGLTVLLVGGSFLVRQPLSPFVFLIVLYIVTMRSRLLVDLGNLVAKRGNYDGAFGLYRLALAVKPDEASRLIALVNRGAAELHSGDLDSAIMTLEAALEGEKRPRLGIKYEAACRYNLGYAFERKGEEARAVDQYNQVIELLPGSLYAQASQSALKRRQRRSSGE
jgi:tetratricopeptide (TPR) repeat protein